jgi:hypothetical protein
MEAVMCAIPPTEDQKPSHFTSEFASISESIALSDPHKIAGMVYIDYGNPRSPRFLCDAPNGGAFNAIADRYFNLIDILFGDMVLRIRDADHPHRITLHMDLSCASSHERLKAADHLTDLLKAKEVAPERISDFLTVT